MERELTCSACERDEFVFRVRDSSLSLDLKHRPLTCRPEDSGGPGSSERRMDEASSSGCAYTGQRSLSRSPMRRWTSDFETRHGVTRSAHDPELPGPIHAP